MKTITKTQTLSEIFLNKLKKSETNILQTFYSLFSALVVRNEGGSKNYEQLEAVLNYPYEIKYGKISNQDKEDWFYCFHKAFRQVDVFSDCVLLYAAPTITKEETKEREKIIRKLNKHFDSIPAIKQDEKMYKEHKEKFSEEYKRLRVLNSKRNNKELEDIGGHLDMVAWNLIHIDTKNELKEILDETFKDYEKLK